MKRKRKLGQREMLNGCVWGGKGEINTVAEGIQPCFNAALRMALGQ